MEKTQKGTLDITEWLQWYLATLVDAVALSRVRFERILYKARFWQRHAQTVLNDREIKVLNRLLDSQGDEFTRGINDSKYRSLGKVSKATATRELADLVNKGCLDKLPGRGVARGINWSDFRLMQCYIKDLTAHFRSHQAGPLLTDKITQALAALDNLPNTGTFAAKATLPANTLNLSIQGFGNLRLPVATTRAKALARLATPAPFGRGAATVTDPSVRHVGEIKARKVQFDRRAWNTELKPILAQMRAELGLPEGRLTAKLDKLLVYGSGQFFKPHKDTERSDDMVGTLVVVLPSSHKGGSLIVSHQGETCRFLTRNPTEPKLRLFAFYATCEHEVRPVNEGYRVVLSFELRFKRGTSKAPTLLPGLKQALEQWFDPNRKPVRPYAPDAEKLVYLLDHEYSRRSLGWGRLKGVDHARAEALRVAGGSIGLQAHLALITVNETWSASVEEPRYYRRKRPRSNWIVEDDEGSEDEDVASLVDSTHYDLEELIDRGASLHQWRDSSDQIAQLPILRAFDTELCWLSKLEDHVPEFEEYEGYMGNYGNTLEREYKRAAVVLWPIHERYRILASAGGDEGGTKAFNELVADAKHLEIPELEAALAALLAVWPGRERSSDSRLLGAALTLSSHLDDPVVTIELLRSFSLAALRPSRFKALLALGQRYGVEFCQSLFSHWLGTNQQVKLREEPTVREGKPQSGRIFIRHVDRRRLQWLPDFAGFCHKIATLTDDAWIPLPEVLFRELHTLVLENHSQNHKSMLRSTRRDAQEQHCTDLLSLLSAAMEIKSSCVDAVIRELVHDLEHYASEVPIAVLEYLDERALPAKLKKNVDSLRKATRTLVHSRADNAVRTREDWTMKISTDCDCEDCDSLVRFLRSNDRAVGFPLAKKRRMHLHRRIDILEIPVSHNTRRQGSPYVLELRKLEALFSQSERDHARETELCRRSVLRCG